MFTLTHRDETWQYVFVEADSCVFSDTDRELLLRGAIDVYRDKKKEKSVKGSEFEGKLYRGERISFNTYNGREVRAEFDTNKHGKKKARILLVERVHPEWN